MRQILGISAYFHDSAAALLREGSIVAAVQEERFTRKKNDARFPENAVRYCLEEAGGCDRVDAVVFYERPRAKLARLLATHAAYAPEGADSFDAAFAAWAGGKWRTLGNVRREVAKVAGVGASDLPRVAEAPHHLSHAASAFYPSPHASAAVLCVDGVGEWATTTAWHGEGNDIEPLWSIDFPHSLGLLYSAFTAFCGFRVNSGEYKLMGLAPYGRPTHADRIREHLIDLKPDGSFRLDMRYFPFPIEPRMTGERFAELFDGPAREPERELTQREMDLAASIQVVLEEAMLRLARSLREETGSENLCLAGGVALNCVANARLKRESGFERIWIQPAAGDSGGAAGAALAHWHGALRQPRGSEGAGEMRHAFLGPGFSPSTVRRRLGALDAVARRGTRDEVIRETVAGLAAGKVVGWFQGRAEYGPRALGARSILADPRSSDMQRTLNLKIKYRESFRPFAPAVLEEHAADWFDIDSESPFMLFTVPVAECVRRAPDVAEERLEGLARLDVPRSNIPAVTHLDHSARVQTVSRDDNPVLHALLSAFHEETGCPVLVNTSFNVRGEPIVLTPEDAYRCFMATEMDLLVVEDLVMEKARQPAPVSASDPPTFVLD